MSIRLAVYQRESRPLDGLCAQVQCAGYDVFERYTEGAFLDIINDVDVDVFLLDADADRTGALLEKIKETPEICHLPVVLIAEEHSSFLGEISADALIDDVIALPILRDDLRARIRGLARLATMTAELERRLQTLADFGITRQADRPSSTATDRVQALLIGPMGDEQIALIDMLDGTATFTYATTTEQAWHHLGQSYVDMILVTSKVAPGNVHEFCRRVKVTRNLTDLPILIFDDAQNSPMVEMLSQDENIDLLRAPFQPVVMRKRLEVIVRQHRLKHQLRGMMADGLYTPTIDNLTRLYGRGFLYHHLNRSMQEGRERGAPLSVATCTISGLANVNDMLGYPIGDQLIGQLGRALISSCRAQDLVARASGASFCIVLNDTSENEARVVCERVAEILKEIIDRSGGHRLSHIDLTIGMAELAASDTAETLITKALHQPATIALRCAS